jgi:DnaJ homolog subfamily B member 12
MNRAFDIARRKKAEGDIAGALKFAKKSQALYSNPQTEAFLASLADIPDSNGTAFASGTSTPSTPNGEGPTPRKPKQSEHRQGRQDTQYTKEQIIIVERVRKCKRHEYYEILELDTKATDSEIKKRYPWKFKRKINI